MSGSRRWLAALALALAALAAPGPARAAPTVWGRARDPAADQRRALIKEAEGLLIRLDRLMRSPIADSVQQVGALWLSQARALYEQAGAASSRDPFLRLRYASILQDLRDYEGAVRELEAVLRLGAPAPARAEAYRDLAVCYARLDRHEEEIRAYGEALALEPHAGQRSLLLANRAEAYMAMGDITAAADGYRASLSLLGTREMFAYGVTTLWGLGVALDRSGDLESALEHIALARLYDANDRRINGDGWFYVPAYDVHWYKALGDWQRARAAETGAARAKFYEDAVLAWRAYLDSAPPDDHWAPLARVRLTRCEAEREEAARRSLKARSARPERPVPELL